MMTVVMELRWEYHGTSKDEVMLSVIAPVPEMVRIPSQENSQVRLSPCAPHVPEAIRQRGMAWILVKSFHWSAALYKSIDCAGT